MQRVALQRQIAALIPGIFPAPAVRLNGRTQLFGTAHPVELPVAAVHIGVVRHTVHRIPMMFADYAFVVADAGVTFLLVGVDTPVLQYRALLVMHLVTAHAPVL
ncbi:hypothetical protein ACUY4R_004043 [Kosakonia sp. BK9b]